MGVDEGGFETRDYLSGVTTSEAPEVVVLLVTEVDDVAKAELFATIKEQPEARAESSAAAPTPLPPPPPSPQAAPDPPSPRPPEAEIEADFT